MSRVWNTPLSPWIPVSLWTEVAVPFRVTSMFPIDQFINYFYDACGVMVIVVGNGHGDTSSNSGRDWLHFT